MPRGRGRHQGLAPWMTFACAQYEEERKITKYFHNFCTIYFFNAHHTHLAVAHMAWAGEGLSYFCPRPRPPYGACVDPHMGVRGVGGAGSLSILVSAPLGLPLPTPSASNHFCAQFCHPGNGDSRAAMKMCFWPPVSLKTSAFHSISFRI